MNKSKDSSGFPIIAPSVLASDFGNIRQEVKKLSDAGARWFHFDVMDGSFVPPITFGDQLLAAVRDVTDAFFDVHLMTEHPERHIGAFKDAGANMLSVHFETCPHLHYVIDQIHRHGMDAGVVINPATPVAVLSDIVSSVDLVLVMSVNPGWGGQTFIPHTYQKLAELKKLFLVKQVQPIVQIDGGVDLKNAGRLVIAGSHVLVAGSSVYGTDDPADSYHELTRQIRQTQIV